jgi:hypothetical protein
MLTRPPAWAADRDTLYQAKAAGAVKVCIEDLDTGMVYTAGLADFFRRGLEVGRGHGDQLGLPLAFWTVTGGRVTGRPGLDQAAAGPAQLRLI